MEQSTETKLTLIATQDQLSQANSQNLELQSNLQKSDIDSSSLYVRLQEQVNIKWLLKVHIFWEGHKIFVSTSQKKVEISQNFCGLLRIYEL